MASKQYHVMLLPWLAFGHMLPFLKLAKKLAEKGLRVTFVSSPRNIQRLPPISPNLSGNINLVKLPLPIVEGLREDCEATIDLQPEKIEFLKKACDGLREPLEQLLLKELPDLILFDFVQCWVPQVAAKFGVRSAFFSAYAASTLAFIGPPSELRSAGRRKRPEDLAVPPKWFPLTSLICQGPHQAAIMYKNLKFPDVSGMSSGQRWEKTLMGSDFVAVRSCPEFESEYLALLMEIYKKPVLPVGLLSPNFEENTNSINSTWSTASKWLDMQPRKSVLFVGFGTEYKMPIGQIHELAHGLEISGLPFLWVIRKPEGTDSSQLLPDGFLDRTADRGLVSLGWVPQVKILSHPAIGGCLYHSGWSSIIESLGFGLPQILMPMVDDQGLNSKLLVEKGIGFEVPRNEDESFTREGVAKSIRFVLVEAEGETLREKAGSMRTIFADHKLHDGYINKFIEYLSENENWSSHPNIY